METSLPTQRKPTQGPTRWVRCAYFYQTYVGQGSTAPICVILEQLGTVHVPDVSTQQVAMR